MEGQRNHGPRHRRHPPQEKGNRQCRILFGDALHRGSEPRGYCHSADRRGRRAFGPGQEDCSLCSGSRPAGRVRAQQMGQNAEDEKCLRSGARPSALLFGQMAFAPVVAISAKEGEGIDKLMSTIISLYSKSNRAIETAKLNQAVARWIEETPPPAGPRTRFKLRYAVQASMNPQRFIFFVTRPEAVAESYRSFLKNKLRLEFGLDGIPIQLELRASHKDRMRS
jgi:Predicted GTPases